MKKNTGIITTPWFIRLAIYALVAIIGLVAVGLGIVDQTQVDSWLTQTGSLAALIGGLVAATHTGRHSDNTVPFVIDGSSGSEPSAPLDGRDELSVDTPR